MVRRRLPANMPALLVENKRSLFAVKGDQAAFLLGVFIPDALFPDNGGAGERPHQARHEQAQEDDVRLHPGGDRRQAGDRRRGQRTRGRASIVESFRSEQNLLNSVE